jgi:hypothetical protein
MDGRWTTRLTRAQLVRAGASTAEANSLYGPYTVQFGNGRFVFHNGRTGLDARGTFTIHSKSVRFVFASGAGLHRGDVAVCTWSVYRDLLTFKAVAGRPSELIDAGVWVRAR